VGLKETECYGIYLARDKEQWRSPVNTLMSLRVFVSRRECTDQLTQLQVQSSPVMTPSRPKAQSLTVTRN
jgi:hypothetical protein